MPSLEVTFHGVRGSTPCHGDDIARHGGNTSSVSIAVPGHGPVLLDLGTGARYFGRQCDPSRAFVGTALLTHVHWDHTQGLPFFLPLLRDGTELDVYGPRQDDGRSLAEVFGDIVRPPQFPVTLAEFPGSVRFHDVDAECFRIGEMSVLARPVPHIGPTLGYRITWRDVSIAYLPDHQQPHGSAAESTIADGVLELVRDVDLLIHDAQYTPAEFARKSLWGHCTYEYAVDVAAAGGARRLALFHHDPSHGDDQVDEIEREAALRADPHGVEVFAARERMTVTLPAHAAS